MNIILLSGGSGKRLWPLSNDVRSKQFIKLFKNNDEYESMVQRVYRQVTTVDADAKIPIATSKSQASAIKNQLGEKASICVEPCRRDTFPAIALTAAYLHDELGVAEDEAVVVCPVDPYVDNTYYEAVKTLQEYGNVKSSSLFSTFLYAFVSNFMGLTNFRFTKIVTQRIMLIERTIGMVTILTTPRAESTILSCLVNFGETSM